VATASDAMPASIALLRTPHAHGDAAPEMQLLGRLSCSRQRGGVNALSMQRQLNRLAAASYDHVSVYDLERSVWLAAANTGRLLAKHSHAH